MAKAKEQERWGRAREREREGCGGERGRNSGVGGCHNDIVILYVLSSFINASVQSMSSPIYFGAGIDVGFL